MCELVLWIQKDVSKTKSTIFPISISFHRSFNCHSLFSLLLNRNKKKSGIVPKSYIHILKCVLTSKNEYVVKRTAIVDEITTVLGEWGNLFKKFYLTNHEVFQPIRHKILELIGLRSQILSGNLPVDEMKQVKLLATSEIDTGNKLLGKSFEARSCQLSEPFECSSIWMIGLTFLFCQPNLW